MIVKVCGMRDEHNIAQIASLQIDMIGFIFYKKSARYVDSLPRLELSSIARVGVFVDESVEVILSKAKEFGLSYIQLHGSETVEVCRELKENGLKVIKAISIESQTDMAIAQHYLDVADMLLFDTKCSGFGGSGERFNWHILDSYCGQLPFLVSGGIDPTMAKEIKELKHPMFAGVDLNSRFEKEPALKDVKSLSEFITKIKKGGNNSSKRL